MKNELPIVSFGTAKLLKLVRYNIVSKHYINTYGEYQTNQFAKEGELVDKEYFNNEIFEQFCYIPTQALAQMWLRKACNIEVEISVYYKLFDEKLSIDYNKLYSPLVSYDEESALRESEKEYNLILKISNLETPTNQMIMELIKDTFFKTYEEALEIGIQQACEYLIEKQKENG